LASAAGKSVSATGRAGRLARRALAHAARLPARLADTLEVERERWFYWLPALVSAGIGAYFLLASEPRALMAIAIVLIAVALRLTLRRGTLVTVLTGTLLAMAVGFAVAKLRTEWVRAPVLERATGAVEVRGYIELIEPRPSRGERVTLQVTSIGDLPGEATPYRVRIRSLRTLSGLAPGDAIILKARLAPPSGPPLPGGYDFARQAYYDAIGGVGYAVSSIQLDPEAAPPRARPALRRPR